MGSRAAGSLLAALTLLGAASAAHAQAPSPRPASPAAAPVAPAESRPIGLPRALQAGGRHGSDPSAAGGPQPERDTLGQTLSGSTARTAGSLALVLGLIFAAAKLFKKLSAAGAGGGGGGGLAAAFGSGGPSPAGLLEVLGRYPLGRGCTLVLLRLDGRVLLLSQSGGGVFQGWRRRSGPVGLTTLSEISQPEEVASILMRAREAEQRTISAGFRQILGRFDGQHADVEVVDVRRRGRSARSATAPTDVAELLDERAHASVFGGPDSVKSGGGRLRRRLEALRAGQGGER
ncbi:MAG: hypothetical protein ACK4WH_05585 [Phycisphaerales bacterium]